MGKLEVEHLFLIGYAEIDIFLEFLTIETQHGNFSIS